MHEKSETNPLKLLFVLITFGCFELQREIVSPEKIYNKAAEIT